MGIILRTNGIRTFIVISLALLFSACATNIKTDVKANPPPSEPFANFQRFELRDLRVVPQYDVPANRDAAANIDAGLKTKVGGILELWNQEPRGAGRLLVVEPILEQVKVVSTAKRIWGGAFGGSSAVVLKMKYTDQASGQVIADPTFYQHAKALAAAYTFGAADKAMLTRLPELVSNYTTANYSEAIGGPSGAP